MGLIIQALGFLGLTTLPANFDYPAFAFWLLVLGIGQGMFAAPNTSAIMNSVPPESRGVSSGMTATFQNSAQVFSLGVFFSIVTVGLASALPGALYRGLTSAGLPGAIANRIAHLPPTAALFASFLGYNPLKALLPPAILANLPTQAQMQLTSTTYFPNLIGPPFMVGLRAVFLISAALCLIAALASWMRGARVIYTAQATNAGLNPNLTSTGAEQNSATLPTGSAGAAGE